MFFPPNDETYLATVDLDRMIAVSDLSAHYPNLSHRFDLAGADRVEVNEVPSMRRRAVNVGTRILRGAGLTVFAVNSLFALDVYADMQEIDDSIIEAVSESGLVELDAELGSKDVIEIVDFLAQPENQEVIADIAKSLEYDFRVIEDEARTSGQEFQTRTLNAATYGSIGLLAWAFISRDRRKAKANGFYLDNDFQKSNMMEVAKTLLAPTPPHVTRLDENDVSPVMKLDVKVMGMNGDLDDRLAAMYQRGILKLAVGGLVLLNPLTVVAAEATDDALGLTIPGGMQEISSSLGGSVVEYQQDRIEQSVTEALNEKLPNTAAALGGDLATAGSILGDTLGADLARATQATTTKPIEYRPISSIRSAAGDTFEAVMGNPYDQSPIRKSYAWLMLAAASTLCIVRFNRGRPVFSRQDNAVLMSKDALDESINPDNDERGDTLPEYSRRKRRSVAIQQVKMIHLGKPYTPREYRDDLLD